MDGSAYDAMFRALPPSSEPAHSVVVAFDEATLSSTGGMQNVRSTLARALRAIGKAQPKLVAIDITVPDSANTPADLDLASAFAQTPNLILPSNLIPGEGGWEEPAPLFRRTATAVAHVHALPDPVSRVLPLEVAAGRVRRWAIAAEAARLYTATAHIVETPGTIEIGNERVPASREGGRTLYIRYRSGIPQISVADILRDPRFASQIEGKAVFVGVTPQTAARDRLMTPMGAMMSGVEIHAQAFETLIGGRYLQPISHRNLLLLCSLFTAAAGAAFAFARGWLAYVLGAGILLLAHAAPPYAFSNGIVLPYLSPVLTAWFSVGAAAAWRYFVVRGQLYRSESEKARYQQAIHFVTHEMRSPLTAIQGSSEMMGRYNLNEEKRKQMALTINTESKRLARMVQTFLDVERLTDGQMELRSEQFDAFDVIDICIERARPLAQNKDIALRTDEIAHAELKGDRELLEYAVYNLLTNAVKYSPGGTVVTISAQRKDDQFRVLVRDEGIGMDAKELRSIFKKFYRTGKAEASGEAGTGIGLSIVQQIVEHHGGRMEVTSAPGKGSCFTMVLPSML